jgi:hypothetical protein
MFVEVPFGEWMPDLPARGHPGALIARNVIPEVNSYRPLRAPEAYSTAMAGRVLGAFWAQDDSNTMFNFAGDGTDLYRLSATGVWDVISQAGGYSAVDWEFAKFGDRILAAHRGGVPQFYDMATGGLFADLAGSPPQAARVAVVRDFVVLGDIAGAPARVQWSGFNNSTLWTPTASTAQSQADTQDIFGRGGRVQKIVGGEEGLIFLENSIVIMRYVGPDLVFTFAEVEANRGTPAPGSVVRSGDTVFFYAHDGFYAVSTNGAASKPIGHNRVDRWFEVNASVATLLTMKGGVDRRRRLVVWSFSSAGALDVNDTLLIYNYGADKWSYATVDTDLVSGIASSGYNLDTLDSLLTGGIDAGSFPVDSSAFAGGALDLAVFDSTHRVASFNGTPLAATIDTKEFDDAQIGEGPSGRRIFTRSARPLVDGAGATLTVQVGHRDTQNSPPSFAGPYAVNSIGEANYRRDSRYQRMRVVIDGEFDHATGCIVDAELSGRR